MIPMTTGLTFNQPMTDYQTSPELRRMDMYNRARREEMDALLYNLDPRTSVAYRESASVAENKTAFTRLLNGLRSGIGSALITAGTRIQSTA